MTRELPAIASKLTTTQMPGSGKTIHMQPMAVDMPDAHRDLSFAPKYGEHTDAILEEAGFDADTRARLRNEGVVQ